MLQKIDYKRINLNIDYHKLQVINLQLPSNIGLS